MIDIEKTHSLETLEKAIATQSAFIAGYGKTGLFLKGSISEEEEKDRELSCKCLNQLKIRYEEVKKSLEAPCEVSLKMKNDTSSWVKPVIYTALAVAAVSIFAVFAYYYGSYPCTFVTKLGDRYEGECDSAGASGKGVIIGLDGTRYENDLFINGTANGWGRVIRPDGSVYEGFSVDGKMIQ